MKPLRLYSMSFYSSVFLVAYSLFFSAVSAAGNAGSSAFQGFPLRVADVAGLNEPWPAIGGLPFPQGAAYDSARLRVVDATGAGVPAQFDVVSTWPDGSIRWAQVGLMADPQGEYRVEFGPTVVPVEQPSPLKVNKRSDGSLIIDTGVAHYKFLPDLLLPDSAEMRRVSVFADSGDGAYLIDNRGRLARVAGAKADLETQILKEGPVRVVVRREGWYVTADGDQIARARMWFYFTAGSPFVRMTHSIVFTENTNDLWVRDYGLEFRTSTAPEEVIFALGEATGAERVPAHSGNFESDVPARERARLFSSGLYEREQWLFPVTLAQVDGEVYLLQDEYPQVAERSFRAIIGEAPVGDVLSPGTEEQSLGNLWIHSWLTEADVAGDWAEARYADHALMVVMPQLAQRFPKEIAVGPHAVRVAFWSGRSGRDLDFRAVTLVNEVWKSWADRAHSARSGLGNVERGEHAASVLAQQPSNAQGAARTHDVWLLPRTEGMDERHLKARAIAAAHPPLLQADPAWLGESLAVGWPLHPKDSERFPEVEETISEYWDDLMGGVMYNAGIRRSGFLKWGKNLTLARISRWFRISRGAGQYGMDRSAWQLYMRSGERHYYDYARHFTRFSGDLNLHHWDAGRRFRGGFASPNVDLPFYWEGNSQLSGNFWTFGWLMDYYLSGDEYANELLSMVADAYRNQTHDGGALTGYTHAHVYNLSTLYQHSPDERIRELAQQAAHTLIDLENPTGLNDNLRYGVYYKISTEWLFPLYLYYNATGDPIAKEAILRAVDDKFRFNHEDHSFTPTGRGPSSSQNFRMFIFAEAYRWTGNPAYLGFVEHMLLKHPNHGLMGHPFYQGAPAAQYLLANTAEPVHPFPLLALTRDPESGLNMDFELVEADVLPPIQIDKTEGTPVTLSVYIRMPNEMDENMEPTVIVREFSPEGQGAKFDDVEVQLQQSFETRNSGRSDVRRWHLYLTLAADAEPGLYNIHFPNAATIVLLESDAPASLP